MSDGFEGRDAIWAFDLSAVTARVAKKGAANAAHVEHEFRRFAELCLSHRALNLSPSLAVDEYWHEFLLDTPRYRTFCQAVYGGYLDHIPDESGRGMMREFERTLEAYRSRFGAPDAALWSAPGNSMDSAPPRREP